MRAVSKVDYLYESANKVETAFYRAFGEGDFVLMESLFADEGVSCTHPGGSTIVGRENVLNNWEFVLVDIPKAIINWEVLSVTKGKNVEVHVVLESFIADKLTGEMSEVYATNVYIEQEDGWRLQSQHASVPKSTTLCADIEFEGVTVMPHLTSLVVN